MSVKKNIPVGWELKRFTDFCDLKHGFQFREEHFVDEGVPVIKIGSLVDGAGIREDNLTYVKQELVNQFDGFKLNEGDILMALTGGTLGKVCIFPKRDRIYLQNYRVGKFIPHKIAAKEYIVQLLQSYIVQERILNLVNEAAQPNFGKQDFDKIEVDLPPLPEQKAIAQVLSTADAAIHTTENLISQKELRKKWLMQQLLTGKKRLKGFSGKWKENKLSDLFERVTRKNKEGNTTVVTISAQRGFVRQTDFFNKNISSEITDNYFLVERGEFCYNKSYSNGYPWGATKRLNDFEKAVVTTLYICFGIKDITKANPDFFEQYFNANLLDKGLTKIAHEGGRAHGLLNVTPLDFFSLKVTVPSIEEQTAIAQVLQAADKEISLLKAKAEKLREQKKGLMQVLLTGKVRLKINN